jgi:hypothetical protein
VRVLVHFQALGARTISSAARAMNLALIRSDGEPVPLKLRGAKGAYRLSGLMHGYSHSPAELERVIIAGNHPHGAGGFGAHDISSRNMAAGRYLERDRTDRRVGPPNVRWLASLLLLLLGVAVLWSCDEATGPRDRLSGLYVLETVDGQAGPPFITWDHVFSNGSRVQSLVLAESLSIRTDTSLQWAITVSQATSDAGPPLSAHWSATFSYRRSGDRLVLTIQDPFASLAGRSPDTLVVRSDGKLVNTVEVGGGCQDDPTCVPGGEFRDVTFLYRRVLSDLSR